MTILPFGRHRGQSIEEVFIDYVQFVLSLRWLRNTYPNLCQAARDRVVAHYAVEIAKEYRDLAEYQRQADSKAGLDLV